MNTKEMIIMRGLPGSGKSTLAIKLANEKTSSVILSTDDTFMAGQWYLWCPEGLYYAHRLTQLKTTEACHREIERIIIDNTNIKHVHYDSYIEIATTYGYKIRIQMPETSWAWNIHECAVKNRHGVPLEAIQKMAENFQHDYRFD